MDVHEAQLLGRQACGSEPLVPQKLSTLENCKARWDLGSHTSHGIGGARGCPAWRKKGSETSAGALVGWGVLGSAGVTAEPGGAQFQLTEIGHADRGKPGGGDETRGAGGCASHQELLLCGIVPTLPAVGSSQQGAAGSPGETQ